MDKLLALLDSPQVIPCPLLFSITLFFHCLFITLQSVTKMKTTFGEIAPLGPARLKVILFFETLFMSNRPFLEARLHEIGVLKRIVDLFFEFEWNNLLHCVVDRIVRHILTSNHVDLKKQVSIVLILHPHSFSFI